MTARGSSVRIIAVGDICPGDHYFSLGHGVRGSFERYGQHFLFANVKQILQQSDVCFCNLEGVISDVGLNRGSFESIAFRGHPAMAQELRDAGFTIVNIANNHVSQHGPSAFADTVATLKTHGLRPLGLRSDGIYSSLPVISACNGIRLGFLGYSLVPDPYAKGNLPYAMGSAEQIKRDVSILRQKVDFIFVSCHYGIEATPAPSLAGVDFARELADAGVDVFIGHHPHVFQPIEKYHNSIILYSLGNFVSDFFWDHRAINSGIVEIELTVGKAVGVRIHPVRTNRSCQPECREPDSSNYVDPQELVVLSCPLFQRELRNYFYYVNAFKAHMYLNVRKLIYFLINFPFGFSRLKAAFLCNKILSRIREWQKRRTMQTPQ